jgi:hypothetical protein
MSATRKVGFWAVAESISHAVNFCLFISLLFACVLRTARTVGALLVYQSLNHQILFRE